MEGRNGNITFTFKNDYHKSASLMLSGPWSRTNNPMTLICPPHKVKDKFYVTNRDPVFPPFGNWDAFVRVLTDDGNGVTAKTTSFVVPGRPIQSDYLVTISVRPDGSTSIDVF